MCVGGGEQKGSGLTYHLWGISLTSYLFHKILRYEVCSWASGIFQPCAPSVKHTASPLLQYVSFKLSHIFIYLYVWGWKCGSTSVSASTEKQRWNKRRRGQKREKGWINSPTAASCSSVFWNICQGGDKGRCEENTEKENKLQRGWRETKNENKEI